VFKIAGIILGCALLFLAGCATPTEDSPPAGWSAQPVLSATKHTPPPAPTNFFLARTNVSAATNLIQPAPALIYTWTALNRWAAEHKIGAPHKLSDSPLTTYALGSSNGVMILAIGSHGATWNGTEIQLAFEPQIIDGEIFLHGRDLQKNFEPLLCGTPLTFGTNRVIVLDPGHGGINAGTLSVLDRRGEKEFTLDWAQRLAPLLAADGWHVFLTRTNDTDIALSNRVSFAEAHHADLFISLHFNSAAPDTKQAGLETYCLTPTGMPSTLTRGYEDIWSQNYPVNAFDAPSLQLAVRLHGDLLRASGEEDRGVRRARFIGVLRGQKRPAILIEGGYLSNPHEARRIEDPAFRQKLAEAVANALK
jgi:N-acetylmuramoyl-L-alanine amidase